MVSKQISYGFEAWYSDLRVHALRKLSSFQRLGLMSILHPYRTPYSAPYRTISTDVLCMLCGIPPLHIELKYLAKKHPVLFGDSHFDLDDLRINKDDIMEKIPTFRFPNYYLLHNLNIISSIKNVDLDESKLMIFTDG